MDSHWVGFTFPGMIEEPGSFSGKESSPRPQRGPDPRNLISLAIFIRETASVFRAPERWTSASLQARLSNLFSAVTKLYPVSFFKFSTTASAKPTYVFRPVPTAVPP